MTIAKNTFMKTKEIQEMKTRPVEELNRIIKESNEKLRALGFDLVAGKVKNVSEIKELRKKVARAMTFIRQAQDAK